MKKDLPNIYKGKVKNDLNQKIAYISNDIEEVSKKSINDQIKDIFESDKFLYKAETLITLNNGDKIKKTIIGKTNNSLITIDDELIEVSNISKIELI